MTAGRRLAAVVSMVLPSWLAAASMGAAAITATSAPSASASASASDRSPADPRRSGRLDMSPATRAMQDDDAQNPGMLWLQAGEAAWRQPAGTSRRSCADCHGEPSRLRGVAARHPAWDAARQAPLTLGQRIRQCRVERQGAAPPATESDELLGLETLVALASRGLPVAPDADPRLTPWIARGEQRWRQRIGQLNLSCAQCHDERAGGKLAGTPIPQAHPTGYPQYRLEWQALGSLQRRLRNCVTGVRAEPWPDGDVAWTEIELYLKRRAAGMPMEAPAVRP